MGGTNKIVIVGAGTHGRVVLDTCESLGWKVAGFLDDTLSRGASVNGVPVLGGVAEHADFGRDRQIAFHVALGDNRDRGRVAGEIELAGGKLLTIADPSSQISRFCQIDAGTFIGPLSRVRPNAHIGGCGLIEGGAAVGTDSVIGRLAFVGPGCQLTAASCVGEGARLGAGSVLVESARVGAWSVVGAGATVIGDVPPRVLVVGVPARIKRRLT